MPETKPSRRRRSVSTSDLVGRRIVGADIVRVKISEEHGHEDLITALDLDDGTRLFLDAISTDYFPLVTLDVSKPEPAANAEEQPQVSKTKEEHQ